MQFSLCCALNFHKTLKCRFALNALIFIKIPFLFSNFNSIRIEQINLCTYFTSETNNLQNFHESRNRQTFLPQFVIETTLKMLRSVKKTRLKQLLAIN